MKQTCIELRLRPPEWYAEQQRLFLEVIRPLTNMKVYVYSIYIPTVIVDATGNIVRGALPDEAQGLIKRIDDEIQRVADSWAKA